MTGLGRVFHAEWIKVRSLRSPALVVALAALGGLAVGLLQLASTAAHWHTLGPADRAAFDPVGDSFAGFEFTQLAFGAVGLVVATGEYTTRTIGPTLTATPRRLRVYLAKLLVVLAGALPICLGCAFAAFLIGQQVLAREHLGVSLGDPHVLRAVTAAGVYLTAVTLVGFGLGSIIRHTAGALTVMVALVFLSWPLARALETFSYQPDRWLLVNAADALVSVRPIAGPSALRAPSFAVGCLEVGCYLVVLLGLGGWRSRQDA